MSLPRIGPITSQLGPKSKPLSLLREERSTLEEPRQPFPNLGHTGGRDKFKSTRLQIIIGHEVANKTKITCLDIARIVNYRTTQGSSIQLRLGENAGLGQNNNQNKRSEDPYDTSAERAQLRHESRNSMIAVNPLRFPCAVAEERMMCGDNR